MSAEGTRRAIIAAFLANLGIAISKFFAFLITGSFIIERIFNIPGVGQYCLNSITTRDYSLLMAMTMLYAFAVAFLNVVVDVLYAYIDPRIRYS